MALTIEQRASIAKVFVRRSFKQLRETAGPTVPEILAALDDLDTHMRSPSAATGRSVLANINQAFSASFRSKKTIALAHRRLKIWARLGTVA